MRNTWLKWLLGLGVIGVAVGVVTQLNFSDNLVYFYTPQEATAKAAELQAKSIKIGGMIMPGTVQWDAKNLDLAFTMTDLKGIDIAVTHKGIKPDMFKEGQGVVVEGKLDASGKHMVASKLMVKHSEEYKKPGDEHGSMNKALLEDSLFKGEANSASPAAATMPTPDVGTVP